MGIIMPPEEGNLMAEINITPLTDVLLVLLIIFMVSATFISKTGFQLNLPKASTNQLGNPSGVMINITKEGGLYVENQSVMLSDLEPFLKGLLVSENSQRIIIQADENIPYKDVILVMDKAKEAGYASIALAARKPALKQ